MTLLLGLALSGLALAGDAPAAAPAGSTEALLSAITLPETAEALRKAGMPDADIKDALKAAQEKKLSAGEAADTFKAAGDGVRQHGAPPAFAAFVRSQLEAGKRGPELKDAILAECAARGVKPPPMGGQGAPPPGGPPPGQGGDPHGKGLPPGAPEGAPPPPAKPPGAPEGAPDHPEGGKGGKAPPPKGK